MITKKDHSFSSLNCRRGIQYSASLLPKNVLKIFKTDKDLLQFAL